MKFLVALLLSCCVLLAQDLTCNSGDIIWVSETVTADTDIAAGGAEFNNPATPFGIQGAFDADNLCGGAIIRILDGANDYGPSSTSWTNRTDTTKKIVITEDHDAAFADFIRIEGWADSSTRCGTSGNRWTAACPVFLDFDRDNIVGDDGFEFTTTGDGYMFEWIGVRNTDVDGFAPNTGSINVFFTSVAVVNATGSAIGGPQNSLSAWHLYDSYLSNVGTGGSAAVVLSGLQVTIANNIIDCAPGGSPISGQNGIYSIFNNDGPVIVNNLIRNCNAGLRLDQTESARVIRNTIENAPGGCILVQNAAIRLVAIMNVMTGCANSIPGGTNHYLIADNIYSAGTNQVSVGQIMTDVDDADNNNGTTFSGAACVFEDTTDESIASGCLISKPSPGGELASQDGIVPGFARESLSAGGGAAVGVSFGSVQ